MNNDNKLIDLDCIFIFLIVIFCNILAISSKCKKIDAKLEKINEIIQTVYPAEVGKIEETKK